MPKSDHAVEVLSVEEIALLRVLDDANGEAIDVARAVERTGLDRGLCALGLELLLDRGLVRPAEPAHAAA